MWTTEETAVSVDRQDVSHGPRHQDLDSHSNVPMDVPRVGTTAGRTEAVFPALIASIAP